MSKLSKYVFNIIVLFFMTLGIYFKITDASAQGGYVSRNGDWHKSAIGANALFFFAFIFLAIRIMIMDRFKKE